MTGIDLLAGAANGTSLVAAATELAPALAIMNLPSLLPKPKSLFDLWDEYLNGGGGGEKASKAFLGD
jgi:hypothetical protein